MGVSGHEDLVKQRWQRELQKKAFETRNIPEHNLYALSTHVDENKPLVYLSAHCDEIGFVITHVNEEGFVYFAPVDDNIFDITAIRAKKVRINHEGKIIKGVIGHPPSHCLPWDPSQKIEWKHLWIDIGAKNKHEALKMVSIGDPVGMDRTFDILNEKYIVSGALDNRASCYAIADVFSKVAEKVTDINFISALHVQEEIDQRGAQMAAYHWQPSLHIVVDVIFALDHPEVEVKNIGKLGLDQGPIVVWNSALSDRFTKLVKQVAQGENIPFQEMAWGGKIPTDAFHSSKVRHGIPTICVGIPLRYMHTNGEMVAVEDIENTTTLLQEFIFRLNKERSTHFP